MKKLWDIVESIVRFFLLKVFRLKLSEKQVQAFLQFVKFGIVGLSNTILGYIIYLSFYLLFRKLSLFPKVDYLVAQIISFILACAWSFFWNNKYVFKESESGKRNVWKALIKTYISYSFTGLLLTPAISALLVEIIHVPKVIAPLICLLFSVPINFLINKFWAFRGKKPAEPAIDSADDGENEMTAGSEDTSKENANG